MLKTLEVFVAFATKQTKQKFMSQLVLRSPPTSFTSLIPRLEETHYVYPSTPVPNIRISTYIITSSTQITRTSTNINQQRQQRRQSGQKHGQVSPILVKIHGFITFLSTYSTVCMTVLPLYQYKYRLMMDHSFDWNLRLSWLGLGPERVRASGDAHCDSNAYMFNSELF